jgi:hypothetical protein
LVTGGGDAPAYWEEVVMKSVWHMLSSAGAKIGLPSEVVDRRLAESVFQIALENSVPPDERGEWKLVPTEGSGQRCDFCLAVDPPWLTRQRLAAVLPGLPDDVMEDWLACGECLTMAQNDRWDDLLDRMVQQNMFLHPQFREFRVPVTEALRATLTGYRAGWDRTVEPNPKVEN